MFTSREPIIIAKRERCAACGSIELEVAIELPDLPLTGMYSREAMQEMPGGIDQRLLICAGCGHAQLIWRYVIYWEEGEQYATRN